MRHRRRSSGIPKHNDSGDCPSQIGGVGLGPAHRDKPAGLYRRSTSLFGPIGVSVYLAGFALPLAWDLPLILLAVISLPAILSSQ